jgi:hypothetical protein
MAVPYLLIMSRGLTAILELLSMTKRRGIYALRKRKIHSSNSA